MFSSFAYRAPLRTVMFVCRHAVDVGGLALCSQRIHSVHLLLYIDILYRKKLHTLYLKLYKPPL